MIDCLVYVESFLPASQAFIVSQASAFSRVRARILAGKRKESPHTRNAPVQVDIIADSPSMRFGELLLKTVRLPVPALFPAIKSCDIVHAHFGKNGYVIGPLARAAGKPQITTFHGFDATYTGDPRKPGGFNQVRFFRQGRQEMAGWNSWNIAVSDFIRDRLLALGYPQDRVLRHYIGIDLETFRPVAIERKPNRIVSVSRFVDYKGHRYMVEALARVAAAGVPVEFVMVGEGPLRNEIEALARRQLPSVEIHSKLSQAEIRNLMASAALYLHGSVTLENGHAEAFGIANLEAQAMGTPVVAFRSGGVGEAVSDGKTGFLLAERDVNGMANAIGRLLSDRDEWTGFSSLAPSFVRDTFDVRTQAKSLEDYYAHVIDRNRKTV